VLPVVEGHTCDRGEAQADGGGERPAGEPLLLEVRQPDDEPEQAGGQGVKPLDVDERVVRPRRLKLPLFTSVSLKLVGVTNLRRWTAVVN
jgi:hypothetical protein